MQSPLRALRDQRGATVVEFAFITPLLLTLLFGAVEFGHLLLARAVLDGSVLDAARLATASLETAEAQRTTTMRTSITRMMGDYPLQPGRSLTIETTVFRDFSTAYPEPFQDANSNGVWNTDETYVDRNQNGRWDPATPISGTLGGPGDVVSYTVVYPKQALFSFLQAERLIPRFWELRATTVVRNEAVVRRTGS